MRILPITDRNVNANRLGLGASPMAKLQCIIRQIIIAVCFLLCVQYAAAYQNIRLLTGVVRGHQEMGIAPGLPNVAVRFCREDSGKPGNCSILITTLTDEDGRFVFALPPLDAGRAYSLKITFVPSCTISRELGTGSSEKQWLKEQVVEYLELDCQPSLREAWDHPQSPGPPDPYQPDPGKKKIEEVLFGTDRSVETVQPSIVVRNTNSANDTLTYGTCRVAIDTEERTVDGLTRFLSDRDANPYYAVQEIKAFSWQGFESQLQSALHGSSSHDALLFVHGYNTSFDEACRRAAQLAYETKFNGIILLYSWPSHNSWLKYAADEEMVEWSQPHFNGFLKNILSLKGIQKVTIVAHSMGNRLILRALCSDLLSKGESRQIGEVVLAAPDVNRLVFEQYRAYRSITNKQVTLYASDHDQALRLSKWFHSYIRAGDARPSIEIVDGVESIDASEVDTSFLGHSYIGESRSVLADLASLISSDTEPDKRFGLRGFGRNPNRWWAIEP
jgi:esterase/lipase superfamily enzyme